MAATPTASPSETESAETLEKKFDRLATIWHKAVAHHSSSRVRRDQPAYQEIIRMGRPVVPYLLRDLEITGRHWFDALAEITGADPVSDEDAGNIAKMKAAWLRWGQENGVQWWNI
jgi:hypothetical protein